MEHLDEALCEFSESVQHNAYNAWTLLELSLQAFTIEQQLSLGSSAVLEHAAYLKERSQTLLAETRDSNDKDGPLVSFDLFTGIVRMTSRIDLEDLKEPKIEQQYSTHAKHDYPQRVDKEAAVTELNEIDSSLFLAQIHTIDDIKTLAGSENVELWKKMILTFFKEKGENKMQLKIIAKSLKMAFVEVWIGVLLGDFILEQKGDFYDTDAVWVSLVRERC